VLSRNLTNIEQLTLYMNECKRMGISVLGPDINESMRTFSSNAAGDVRFGLAAVKGVGAAAVESIIAERKANGPFKDIYDFVERVNYSLVNRKCLENLAYAGAFDSISDFARCKYFGVDLRDSSGITFIEQLMRYGQRFQTEQNNAQQSLFGGGEHVDIQRPVLPACADWSQLEKLTKEREMVGLYLSAHPLDDYKIIIDHMCKTQLSELENLDALKGQEIAVAGMVVGVQNLMTKTGKPWGKFKLEDYNGGHEFALFGKDYENFRKYLFRPGPRAGQALQRQGAGIQDHFDGSVAGDARHDQGDDRAAADRGGDRSVHSRPDGEGPRVEGRHAAAPERLRPRSAGLAAPLLEKPQGEPLAISGRIFGRQQHPLLNRISIL